MIFWYFFLFRKFKPRGRLFVKPCFTCFEFKIYLQYLIAISACNFCLQSLLEIFACNFCLFTCKFYLQILFANFASFSRFWKKNLKFLEILNFFEIFMIFSFHPPFLENSNLVLLIFMKLLRLVVCKTSFYLLKNTWKL